MNFTQHGNYFFDIPNLEVPVCSPPNRPRLVYCEVLLRKYDVKLLNPYANRPSVTPLIEHMHIYQLSAIMQGLYIKHCSSGRVWNLIVGGSDMFVLVSEEADFVFVISIHYRMKKDS